MTRAQADRAGTLAGRLWVADALALSAMPGDAVKSDRVSEDGITAAAEFDLDPSNGGEEFLSAFEAEVFAVFAEDAS